MASVGLLVVLGVLAGVGSTLLSSPLILVLGLVGAVVAVSVLTRPFVGLVLLVPSMLLSPTFVVGELPFRSIELRIEDGLLLFIAAGILLEVTRDHLQTVKLPPLVTPLFLFLGTTAVAFTNGILFQEVNILQSLLYMLKFFEYVFLSLAVVVLVRTKRQFETLLAVFLFGALVVSLSGVLQASLHFLTPLDLSFGRGYRSRFTGLFAGPTVFGAFTALVVPFATALSFHDQCQRIRLIASGVAVVSLLALFASGARGGFVGAIAGIGVLTITVAKESRKPYITWENVFAITLLAGVFVGIAQLGSVLGLGFFERLQTLFTQPLSSGLGTRIEKWLRFLLNDFTRNPILGAGIANAPWYNSYYVRLLVEQGLLSFVAFLWFFIEFLNQLVVAKQSTDGLYRYVLLGVLGSTGSFLVLNIPAEMFIVARTAQPFWFLVGLAIVIPVHLLQPNSDRKE